MDDSMKGFVVGARIPDPIWLIVLIVAVVIGTPVDAQVTQGGLLVFAGSGRLAPTDTTYVEHVVLRDYVGEPLKALQLRVISQGGIRLRSVERGADLTSAFEWNMSHVIVRGQNGVDTAKVVIFGMGHNAFPPRAYTELLKLHYDVISPNGATLVFSDVLGALSRGEDAKVVAGSSRTLSVSKRR